MSGRPAEAKRLFRRIIVTFLSAIVLPSILLSYFGMIAIEREKVVLNTGIKENHMAVANFVYAQLKEEILSREGKVRRDVNLFLPANYEAAQVARLMDRLREVHKIVAESFLLTDDGELLYPVEMCREGSATGAPVTMEQEEFREYMRLEGIYNEGRRFEFSEGDFKQALEKYLMVASDGLSNELAAQAGLAAGRCWSKLGEHESAARAYEELLSTAPAVRLPAGLPVFLDAHFSASRERMLAGQPAAAAQLLLGAYGTLLEPGCVLGAEEFAAAVGRIRADLDALDARKELSQTRQARYRALGDMEKLRLSQDGYAKLIRAAFLPQLRGAFEKPASVAQAGRHLSADVRGEKVTVMFFFPLNIGMVQRRAVRYLYGCVLNADYIRELAVGLLSGGRFEEGLVVVARNSEEVAAVSPEPPPRFVETLDAQKELISAKLHFSEIIPHWAIEIYYLNKANLDRWISRRLLSHMAMVVLLVAVILVGVFLSLRGIARELDLAKMKSDFVSNVSHELRTPLTSIRMFAEMLKTGRVKDAARQQEYYVLMTAESERLSRLINNVLDFARVEEGRKEYRFLPLDAGEAMSRACEIMRPHIIQQGFKMEVEPPQEPLPVSADKDSLEQVMLNLLDNAVKYSEEVKEIRVRASSRGKDALIEVADRGIGIPESEIPRIFTKFHRADQRPGYQSSGTGLGLTIARQIMEAHGGRIEVKSEPGSGSTFSVVLPLRQACPNAGAEFLPPGEKKGV